MFETPFYLFLSCDFTASTIVFYLESRASDPREEIYGTTEDRLHIFFECFYCKTGCWKLEEKGTLCELMGDVSYFRRENSVYSSQDLASLALLFFYVLFCLKKLSLLRDERVEVCFIN